ncbi:MAG: hypothetical protein M1819_006442 [Sarea resinae]|nr:MAG: hypothetical protein M1819_006442 [Sarea resinae]
MPRRGPEKEQPGEGESPRQRQKSLDVPRYLLSPGDEGYRTPTIEDVEKADRQYQADRDRLFRALSNYEQQADGPLDSPSSEQEGQQESGLHMSALSLRERIRHFTWGFFTMTMATGGIANVIHTVPFHFHGQYALGCIFFLLNIVLYIINVSMISMRFIFFPRTLRASFIHPTESLFIPASVVSLGTILLNISQYGLPRVGHWLHTTMMVMFWIYAGLAMIFSVVIYLMMWSTQTFTIGQMTPIWIFPAYPLLIIGPQGAVLSSTLAKTRAYDIAIGAFTFQGIGFMVSLMIYAAFIYRLMTQKLPKESLRPGMFVSVGPAGFTATAVANIAGNASRLLPADFMGNGALAADIVKVVGSFFAIWLWGLGIWFFLVSTGAHLSCVGPGKLDFSMTWYSFVFPNTALVTATFAIGHAFDSHAIQVVACVMSVVLVAAWLFVFAMMVRAIVLKQILWPQKGEDRDEGGWKGDALRGQMHDAYVPNGNGRGIGVGTGLGLGLGVGVMRRVGTA